jgi:hypothetical protein
LLLKCAHLVTAKAPLPEEVIFNWNKAATERQWAVKDRSGEPETGGVNGS